jgi:hypothetical protein
VIIQVNRKLDCGRRAVAAHFKDDFTKSVDV